MSETKAKGERWTEIEHLPEWDDEYYYGYTAKKFGKWVMLKTLRPELQDKPEMQEMMEKEFDVRYNLAHPNIIMINDFEEVPGIGRCIITDDVYGLSLRKLLESGKVTQHHVDQLKHQLVSAMDYIERNHLVHHPIRPETIIFTENIENLKLIDVGFDQKSNLTQNDVANDIYNYGITMREVLDRSGIVDPELRKIVDRCIDPNPRRRYRTVEDLRMDIDQRSVRKMYTYIITFLVLMIGVLIFLKS